jgi:hypothetical protein
MPKMWLKDEKGRVSAELVKFSYQINKFLLLKFVK